MASAMNGSRFSHLRPMDFGEILDTTIHVLKTGWKPLLLSGLLGAIPMIIYSGLANMLLPTSINSAEPDSSWFVRAVINADAGNFTDLTEMGGLFVAIMLVSLLLDLWLQAAIVVAASRTYLGLPVTLGSSLAEAGRRYPALLGTGLLIVLFGILAAIGLVIGGLVFLAFLTVPIGMGALAVYASFTIPALVIERADGGTAPIRRSFRLVSGRFWPLLGLAIVFAFFAGALSSQVQFITQLPLQWAITFGWTAGAAPILGWVLAVVTGLISSFITPLTYTALTLAYYDTRMRKEGLDLEMMASSGAEPR
ncbi:MAG: hypothetical protein K0R39_3901 [Symbiobacteriaceae bacterium]|nr:hypothetical protein [Symbiobacteriaceae bacterium]